MEKNSIAQLKSKKIRPVLKQMSKGDTESWPIYRSDVVRATINRLQYQLIGEWKTEKQDNLLSVTRIA